MSIFKACDIRGRADEELTPDRYRSWGRLLGQQFRPGAKFTVGGDVRSSTPEFLDSLVLGLCEAGLDVVNLGIVPTPMVYYARRRLQAAGCAVVTASHNPPEVNGLKWLIGNRPPTETQVAALREERGIVGDDSATPSCRPTEPRVLDISFDYVAWLQETWVDSPATHHHVLLDPMYGTASHLARRYLQAVFPRTVFSALHDEPDPEFGGRSPDCSQVDLLDELGEAVYRQRAHFGIAIDGDGDRVAFVDHEGTPLSAEEATYVYLRSFGEALAGSSFVHDLKFSDRIREVARQLGAEPLTERSGHAFIRTRMLDTGALFGAEISGHYFFRALDGGDDALFAACWMIDYLARSERALADLRRECPPSYMTPDLRLPVALEDCSGAIDHIRASWLKYPQTTLDGVRIDFPTGWALVRSSVTEPALTFRFESTSWAALHRLVWKFCDSMDHMGDALWARYEAAMGSQCPTE
ncbi:MAG: hypothetical protein IT424_15155 [Pirellulales bacterium]|nr:hypothetical protein [Pirellulales bacterium]